MTFDMKYPCKTAFVAVTLALLLNACASKPAEQQPRSRVSVDGERLVIDGFIDLHTIDQVRALSRQYELTELSVTSAGGDPLAALQLGNWVHRESLNIIVEELCLGPCANYIFTAAEEKHLHPDAVVAWSGGALQESWTQQYQDYLMPGVRFIAENYMDRLYRREARFFDRVGVDQRITVYGHHTLSGCAENQQGFYYSMPQLLRLGVTKIYTDAHWSEAFSHYPEQYCEVELSSELEVFTL